ncbi:small VCP/p97-interacting protein-like [Dendronephthya gigantea]|uniref:small VCP/p97-interacting protein-like n=1 Tax=Dendronephthya gigantea TaxID=151771 RepID=UPI00106D5B3E|nr:small VCP/p97-interacting protein-like [Dendronephthya gigantea]
MGNCFDCFGSGSSPETPDPEERRRRQEAAALKRQRESEGRGLKDPEGVKRKRQEAERTAINDRQGASGGGGLKWTVG